MNILHADAVQRKGHDAKSIIFPGQINASTAKPLPTAWTQLIPGAEFTTPEFVYEASKQFVAAGLSVIPIEAFEGTKSPDTKRLPRSHDPVDGKLRPSWCAYMIRRPNEHELRRWYELGTPYGLAVVCGSVSGGHCGLGLEVIDFDHAGLAKPWLEIVEKQMPGLVNRLVRVQSPRPGLHCYYRCARFGTSQKLAMGIVKDDCGQTALDRQGNPLDKTQIEMKAEGGYCLIPPSPSRCHPTGRLYQYVKGSPDLTSVPTITIEERRVLLDAARSLSEIQDVQPPMKTSEWQKSSNKVPSLDLPGDDFNARGTWTDVLTPHGWTQVNRYGDEERWCRPGKTGGVSATINYGGNGLLHIFSSNASPLEAEQTYSKFAAYTILNHNGNYKESARDLSQQGYGKQTLLPGKR